MAISLPRTRSASDASLAALSQRYGDLPPEYIEFLAVHDGASPFPNVLEGTNDMVGVNSFIPASEIVDKSHSIDGLSSRLLPFAEDGSGNFVCIGVGDHKVYFWDHEIEGDSVVADSFSKFLERLEPFDLSAIQLKPGQVKSVWVNPNFKPEF